MNDVSLGFVCNPYHRGGVTRWMADMAAEWGRTHGTAWFVTARPRRPFVNAGGRPTMIDLLGSIADSRIRLEAPDVDATFEFGMEAYRAAVYARAIGASVPEGTPLIVTGEAATWRAVAGLGGRYPLIGVLHSDAEYYYRRAHRFQHQLAALVSVSRRIDALVQTRNLAPGVVREVIPCGTPQTALPRQGDDERGTVRLLWYARFDEQEKRISDLPAIIARARSLRIDCRLIIAGGGHDEQLLRSAIKQCGVEDMIELVGWKSAEELAELRARSDILLLPSNLEGMPIAVMEALAAGCAVVASRVSGVEDYADHAHAPWCYWVHEIGDTKRAAECIQAAAAVPAFERAAHARAIAHEAFSIEECAQRYRTLIENLPQRPSTAKLELPQRLSAILSMPLAASRMTRLWCASRFGTPKRQAMLQRFAAERQP